VRRGCRATEAVQGSNAAMSRSRVEETLILLSAATSARRAETRAHAIDMWPLVNWSRLTEMLRVRRLLATLGPRVIDLAPSGPDRSFERDVAEALEHGRRQAALLELMGARVRNSLADAGIRSAALKGPQLSERLYGDAGRRPSRDIDLLVAPTQLDAAVEVVRELGYQPPADPVGETGLPLLHFALVHKRAELPPVELHWRVHWYETRFAEDRLLAPAGSAIGWCPEPIDDLVALLLFYARDGFIGLRYAADIAGWWDALGSNIERGAIDGRIRTYPALGRVLIAAANVAQITVGLPAARLTWCFSNAGHRERIAARLAEPHPHTSAGQIYADMALIDGLLTPAGGLRAFISRQALRPRDRQREHESRATGRRVGSSLGHAVKLLVRFGLSLGRALRTT
jgi:Uncharacterised nucleotidyltransferase